ncbi:DUF2141 domain-containing protein [Quatrionicoccus australiensis]|uniref:DUF2141 domain-containing protein n=1 Tax=Quatrionicoccus australiensis TaxID=138118 RepID=UPI001CF9AC20|nr:DUF2141 domain-containing protein [Quatrionicoccus australiensis]MCB4358608.1 DUF2141 domain-containing protein [Quatrionicoccus australiensis]
MKKHQASCLLLAAFCCAPLLATGAEHAQPAARISVILKNVRDSNGMLRASLYRTPESFRKEVQALQVVSVAAAPDDVRLVFDGLAAGSYAIMAYHDENSDGKLNLRLGMFPTEGYGLSNNPKVFGPPKFADSAFDLKGDEATVEIEISY